MASTVEVLLKAQDQASAAIGALNQSLTALGASAKSAGVLVDQFGKPFEKVSASAQQTAQGAKTMKEEFASFLTVFQPVGIAITAVNQGLELASKAWGALQEPLRFATEGYLEFAERVRELSFLSGGSARDTSVLVNGLEALGVGAGTVERGLNLMSRAVDAGSPALNRLGVSIRDANGNLKTGMELFYETIDALGKVTSETERNAIARQIFGRGWMDLAPVMRAGADRVRELGEEAARLGKVMTTEGLEAARQYKLAIHELNERHEALAITIGSAVVPALSRAIQTTNVMLTQGKDVAGEYIDVGEALTGVYVPAVQEAAKETERLAAATNKAAVEAGTKASPVWKDVGTNVEYTKGKVSALTSELERLHKFQAQIAQLQVGAETAAAVTAEEKLTAAIDATNAKRKASLDQLPEMAIKEGWNAQQIADMRKWTNTQADNEIAKSRRDATLETQNFVFTAEQSIYDSRIALERDSVEKILLEEAKKFEELYKKYEDDIRVYGADADRRVEIETKFVLANKALTEETTRKVQEEINKQQKGWLDFYDTVEERGYKQRDLTFEIQDEVTANNQSELDKKLAAVDKWAQDWLKKIEDTFGIEVADNQAKQDAIHAIDLVAEQKKTDIRVAHFLAEQTADRAYRSYIDEQDAIKAAAEAGQRTAKEAAEAKSYGNIETEYTNHVARLTAAMLFNVGPGGLYQTEADAELAAKAAAYAKIQSAFDTHVNALAVKTLTALYGPTGLYKTDADAELAAKSKVYTEIETAYNTHVTNLRNAILLAVGPAGMYQTEAAAQVAAQAGAFTAMSAARTAYLQNVATLLLAEAQKNNDLWAAMQAGALTTYASLGTFWGNVVKGFSDTFTNVNKTMSDILFDGFTNGFKNLGDILANFKNQMIRTFTDILAAEATKSILGLFGIGAGGTGTGGGGINWGGLLGGTGGTPTGGTTGGAAGTGGTGGGLNAGSLFGIGPNGVSIGPFSWSPTNGFSVGVGPFQFGKDGLTIFGKTPEAFGNMVSGWFGAGASEVIGSIGGAPVTGAMLGANPELAYALAQGGTAAATGAGTGIGAAAGTATAGISASEAAAGYGALAAAEIAAGGGEAGAGAAAGATAAAVPAIASVAAFAAPLVAGLVAAIQNWMTNTTKVAQAEVQSAYVRDYVNAGGDPLKAQRAGGVGAQYVLPIYWAQQAGVQIDQENPGSSFREILGDDGGRAGDRFFNALVATGWQIPYGADLHAAWPAAMGIIGPRMLAENHVPTVAEAAQWVKPYAATLPMTNFAATWLDLGGGGGGGGGQAEGGPVWAGESYWVGERGPEPFLPEVNGRILSHEDAMAALGGGESRGGRGGVVVTINLGPVTISQEVDVNRLSEMLAFQSERALVRALQTA
jgi:hypothetical protein